MILNQWNNITHWCPAQLFYYFEDAGTRALRRELGLALGQPRHR